MTENDVERLLWELSRVSGDEDGPPISDQRLEAYRRGDLAAEERREIEATLRTSAPARRRLATLAGIEEPVPPESVRRRVLSARDRRRTSPASLWRLAAAAVLAAGLGLAGWSLLDRRAEPELHLAGLYEVEVEALATRRSRGDGEWGDRERVLPGTRVEIRVEPRRAARAGVDFALYRAVEGGAARVDTEPAVELEAARGAARFVAPAAALLGDEPGRRPLWVVVAAAGDLPERVAAAGEAEIERRLSAGGRRFVRRHLFDVQE